ncbi:apolipoprotein N-acyltransferase [Pseudaestuariivita atlantica]|uniref:apolipoprotein N-acyltransferase n=1 Tax=Pseudaestuariivita atlantica TaxID=1317121 RepID=UPI000A956A38|nr:apolipoprotein N-acyltransferase [Pseudaestuariivita atlantica]
MPRRAPLWAAGAGAVAALGQSPFDLWPAMLAGLVVLFALLRGVTSPRRAALVTWAFGTGYFLVALHWVFEPFLVDAARHAWMAPFAVVFLSAGLALFWVAAAWGAARLGGGVLTTALALGLAEMARGYLLTGFPWAMPGYAWLDTPVASSVTIVGSYGVTALTFVACALVARALPWQGAMRSAVPPVVAVAVLASPVTWAPGAAPTAGADAPIIRLVQPNAPQADKWDPNRAQFYFDRHIALSTGAGPEPDLIVWSETALPMLLDHAGIAFDIMAERAPGVPYLVGVQRRDDAERYYNSAVLMQDGQTQALYDKHHLVPFGEYMPLQSLASDLGMEGLAAVLGGYTPGPGPRLIDLGFATALPLICYEVVFPQYFHATERPDVLIQLTNDAWFGSFSGPYQHLAQARMRSLEHGLPMIRVANTGVSAVIDARGEVLGQIPLDTHGALDAALPPALPATLYARMGDLPVALVLVLGLVGTALVTFRLTGPVAPRTRV